MFSLLITSILSLSISSATVTIANINLNENTANPIHFVDNGNDFGGIFRFTNGITSIDTGDFSFEIKINDSKYICSNQLKGFYYNAQRGERLRPLDKETANRRGMAVSIEGGLYSNCYDNKELETQINECVEERKTSNPEDDDNDEDSYKNDCIIDIASSDPGYRGIYGRIQHTYSNTEYQFIAGVEYENDGSWIQIKNNTKFAPTFQKYNNKYPIGFVYDAEGGLGFIGCEFSGANKQTSLNNILNFIKNGSGIDSFFVDDEDNAGKIKRNSEYTGVYLNCSDIGAMQDTLGLVIEGLIGMGTKSNINSYQGDSSDTKMQYFASVNLNNATLINYAKQKSELLCRGKWNNLSSSNVLCISNGTTIDANNYPGKTIIAKNTDVIVKPDNSKPYDIFIDGGNLYLSGDNDDKYHVFTNKGFTSSTNTSNFKNNNGNDNDIAAANLIKGNLIINGHITGYNNQEIKYKYFIHGKFTSLDTIDDLKSTFTWRCDYGNGTDGYPCIQVGNSYYNAPLIIIDQNYSSMILK